MADQYFPSTAPLAEPRWPSLSLALRRQRFQLGGILFLGVLLPFFLRFGWEGVTEYRDYLGLWGLVLAGIVISHIMVSQFSNYPGETSFIVALPAASMGFGLVVLWIVLTHAPYSRGLLLWGYFATVGWYFVLGHLQSRYFPQSVALIPLGKALDVTDIPKVRCHRLSAPLPLKDMKTISGVMVDLSADLPAEWHSFVLSCGSAGIPIFDLTRTREMTTGQVELSSLANIGFEALLPNRTYQKFKNLLDVISAAVLLPVILPVIAISAAAIRIESRGPAFFVQRRVGYRGKVFSCYKMRSMHVVTDGPSFTVESDPRVTRVGKFIRTYRIDELPQIFNILKGEMSWIGPRPEAVELAAHYDRNIPYYAFRHAVKPGISGWAAVQQGNVAEVTAATTKLRYDFYYIKNRSLALDIVIALKTVKRMLFRVSSW